MGKYPSWIVHITVGVTNHIGNRNGRICIRNENLSSFRHERKKMNLSQNQKVQTVLGPISPKSLGRTLMHEHLAVGYSGWESHTNRLRNSRADMRSICIDRIAELQDLGYQTLLDPCPADLGRDVELMVEVAEATGFNIICATGLYREEGGGAAYWAHKAQYEDVEGVMEDLFVSELTEGIGSTGVRPGIIKCGTGLGGMSEYEAKVFAAVAKTSVATGVPVTTHTDDGAVGDIQQQVLTQGDVPSNRIIIGHSCGTTDTNYHMNIASGGSYLGFDRFGIAALMPDEDRADSMMRLIMEGAGDRIVVSHDSVWCWKGEPFPTYAMDQLSEMMEPTRFDREIIPMLKDRGATEEQIEMLVVDNPRRFFSEETLKPLNSGS